MIFRKGRENLSVDSYPVCFERSDQLRVRNAVLPSFSIDSETPHFSSEAFFASSVTKRRGASMKDSIVSHPLFLGATESIPFYLLEYVFSSFVCYCPSFYACHIFKLVTSWKESTLSGSCKCGMKSYLSASRLTPGPIFSSVKVVLSGYPGNDFAALGDAKTFEI